MTIVGEDCTDIMLDENGQPVADENGEFKTVRGDECWEQDLRLETQTEEGELFYEDEDGDEAYGFGFLDFAHGEDDELTRMEIGQRVRDKLAKREYLDQRKTMQNISLKMEYSLTRSVWRNRIPKKNITSNYQQMKWRWKRNDR